MDLRTLGGLVMGALTMREKASEPDAPALAGAPAAALPCLNSNNSTELFGAAAKRTAFALGENVRLMAEEWGLEKLGFLTLTFADHVTDIREAQRRFNSLRGHVLAERYAAFITVVERQKSGRIHFHLLVVCSEDIRTGFSWEEAEKGVYRSANSWLRHEWAMWRATAKLYGFGRTELLPIKSTEEAIGRYVGKYIAKHMDQRRQDDKGARLVRYARDARKCTTRFAWAGVKPWLWRAKLAQFAKRHGVQSVEEMSKAFGSRWAYRLGDLIAREVLNHWPTVEHMRADGEDTFGDLCEGAFDIERTSSHGAERQSSLVLPVRVVEEWIQRELDKRPETYTVRVWSTGVVERVLPSGTPVPWGT